MMTSNLIRSVSKKSLKNLESATVLYFNGLKHFRLEQGDYVAFGFTDSEKSTLVSRGVIEQVMLNAHKTITGDEIKIESLGTASIQHRAWGDTVFFTTDDGIDFKGIPMRQLLSTEHIVIN